ncbi:MULTISPECIES: hypothetical protein [Streptomyces]|uniref:Lipoprotein n=1 Tax=Streptomyces tsukubensis (strain DSM 42081 / NBRC 108919 / NRRL 18488 / 9993) TaxID=1114943 RepID=I2MUD6_STRT9|nr:MULTISPECIES: hypothetical protein [Streptomyces]AZK92911.1 hypothetical protein B7R87_02710 [Streptomyces tsukubensis]EIF88383.1 hypothetical protein [Streptomyces tsukubensis NRRL18488]MYS63256.1 hypothetical protein [Streptomyces sp. SID5473]QKM70927.1 hypothetical protein STSU_031120 [Streptomyces tsukubensis NRRL18488]TAI41814.1 hypothetical protein EWI31_26210 [Streptomyces tsukubensis]
MTIRTTSRGTARRRFAALAAAPLLSLAAACGGGEGVRDHGSDEVASVPEATAPDAAPAGKPSTAPTAAEGKSAFYDAQMVYVRCMRTKGGSQDFPDPKLSGYLDWSKINKVRDPKGDGSDTKGGRNGVCGPELLAAMNLEPKRDKQKDYESMLAHAVCMRDNGVSKFTNPVMSGGGVMPGGDPNPVNPQLDVESPAYERAREACKGKLLEGLDGMQ